MPRYRYRAYDGAGAVTTGELTVESRQAALQALARKAELPIELDEATSLGSEMPWWRREIGAPRALRTHALSDFMRELSGLVGANLPVDEALRIIAMQPAIKPSLRALVTDILERVTAGASLSAAMAAREGVFPPFVVRLVGAGEFSGSLDTVLNDLSRYLEQASDRASKITAQLLYPVVLIVAGFVALAVITTVLVPAIKPLFEDAGTEPPAIIAFLSLIENTLSAYGFLILVVSAGALTALVFAWRNPGGRLALDRVLLRAPFFGGLIQQSETARLARTLSALVRNGVPLTEALRIASGVLANHQLAAVVQEIWRGVEQGGTLSSELQRSGYFPDLLPRLARVGEETGQLEAMLMKVAEAYERAVQYRLERFMTLLTPVLTVLIGVFVGILIVAVMNAILSANALVLQ
jgi:general secretion pathway protein F